MSNTLQEIFLDLENPAWNANGWVPQSALWYGRDVGTTVDDGERKRDGGESLLLQGRIGKRSAIVIAGGNTAIPPADGGRRAFGRRGF
jgi:hypothetical protein